jgi:hypothetical protein
MDKSIKKSWNVWNGTKRLFWQNSATKMISDEAISICDRTLYNWVAIESNVYLRYVHNIFLHS